MIQFNIRRFAYLVRWSLSIDKRWFVKNTLAWMVAMTLVFLFFTCIVNINNNIGGIQAYKTCVFMVIATSVALFVLGATMMFNSMRGKHDDKRLMMLPASNLEKYVMRYCYWILLLPCFVGAFLMADLLQFLINVLLGHDGAMLIVQCIADTIMQFHSSSAVPGTFDVSAVMILVWLHSLYAVGATFFRSHKYNWILTSIALIALSIILGALWPESVAPMRIDEHTPVSILRILCMVMAVLTVFDFWLSYRIFCRHQVIGRYVNL